ncbi:hypothetical protein GCM10022384_69720 [Streptomyces marokkonensis]|uniref:Uncharacterized protein n=1 Tax=Streptomyces marokkonensis TaxID=324855 RepID=A0ABP7SUX7_9ACTN
MTMTDKQHEEDLERVSQQNSVTDLTRFVEERPRGGFLGGIFNGLVRSAVDKTPFGRAMDGRTDFERHRLNAMIDLVEQTNPEDLESSGRALWEARDAITDAAKELDGHIGEVHWVGESGEAFRKWGRSLVTSTYDLGTFAGGAGDQITAAAVGLAAVRKAMPQRDTRPPDKALPPEQLPTPKQVDGNEEYATAVRVEKDRQEAINLMNRLSSYYAVSREQLESLTAPEFKSMPDVGVPKPPPTSSEDLVFGGAASASSGTSGTAGVLGHQSSAAAVAPVESHRPTDTALRPTGVTRVIAEPEVGVGTTIDSVGTLPSSVPSTTGNITSTTGAPGGSSGTANAFGTGYGGPVPNVVSSRGVRGPNGVRGPLAAQGGAGRADVSNGGSGRAVGNGPVGQAGRTAASGQALAKGVSSAPGPSPMGSGVTGGTARPGGTTAPMPHGGAASGVGRAGGVVGGRPVTGAAPPTMSGQRIPRGTVVGAEAAGSRSADRRSGQGGVFGGPAPAVRPGPTTNRPRTGPSRSERITGSPAARRSAANAERNGMTRGGTGLVRGPGGRGRPAGDRDEEETPRPGRPSEDQETHLPAQQRRDVPPVVN